MLKLACGDLQKAEEYSAVAGLRCEGIGRTIQSDAKDADINNIVKSFGITGVLPQGPSRMPIDLDFVDVYDYKTALDLIKQADAAFLKEVPAGIRRRFNNDPAEYVDFCSDPKNLDELRTLGLAVPAALVEAAPTPAEVKPAG